MIFGNLLVICLMFVHATAAPDPNTNIKIDIRVNGEADSNGADNGFDQSVVNCGISSPSETRIINGRPVNSAGKYPWQVGLSLADAPNYRTICGGSVITNKHILTAAHCFDDVGFFYIGIGTNKKYESNTNIIIPQKQFFVHPNYRMPHSDIAIIELSQPIDFVENNISPICIPKYDSNDYVGINATVSGWGSTIGYNPTPPDKYPYILQEAQIPVLDNTKCKQEIGGTFIKDLLLCAGDKEGFENGGKSTCQRDDGGPLTVQENGQYQQIGVLSGSAGCASKGNPGYYTRVTFFLDWINSTVSPEEIFTVNCGISFPSETRIINGRPVNYYDKYPWQVALSTDDDTSVGSSIDVKCGGSIITNKHILTAAHCFDDVGFFYIHFGINNINQLWDMIPQKQFFVHPNYRFPHYDIAIIELSQPIDFVENNLSPICIPKYDSNDYVGINATISGWGSTIGYNPKPPADYPDILLEAQIPVLDNTKCKQEIDNFIKALMLCAGTKEGFENGGKDTCQGDSGGPVTVEENGQYQQIGVVSGGPGCASKGNPGWYTRVTFFLDWINNIVAPEKVFTALKP